MGIIHSIQISIDYDHLIRQAKQLEEAADTCDEGTARLRSRINDISSYWKGEAADAMFLKLTELYKGNIALQRELREKAAQVRQIAETTKWLDDSVAVEIRGGSGRF